MADGSPEAARRERLGRAGAEGAVLEELLAYAEPLLDPEEVSRLDGRSFPPEAHLMAWRVYELEASVYGAVRALARRFPQLLYPIRDGISAAEGYRNATRKGVWPARDKAATGLPLRRPSDVSLVVHESLAGPVPILIVPDRGDFEDLVRAFAARNEPIAVPASMGACLVNGLNNWDRLHAYRRDWQQNHPDESWDDEFPRVVKRKSLYEDRFIILSTGPYSGVSAAEAGFSDAEWRKRSLEIRRHHEATHYATWRVAGRMRNNLLDEILADYAGLVRTFGRYREDLALLFFGLERWPVYRAGGRLENYRGKPPVSDEALEVVKVLVHEAVRNLARLDATLGPDDRAGGGLLRLLVILASVPLEELAYGDLAGRARAAAAAPREPEAGLRLKLAADGAGVDGGMEAFAAFAGRHELPQGTIADLNVVLDEILSNVAKYAYGGAPGRTFDLELTAADAFVEIVVEDEGPAFDPLAEEDPDTSLEIEDRTIGGLGILLVKRLTDEQSYERVGDRNRLRLRKSLPMPA